MLASRFVKQFEADAQHWQKHLANVADAFVLISEIQRTWSYLEPLFIGSDEVKRELPEDAKRFEGIDRNGTFVCFINIILVLNYKANL